MSDQHDIRDTASMGDSPPPATTNTDDAAMPRLVDAANVDHHGNNALTCFGKMANGHRCKSKGRHVHQEDGQLYCGVHIPVGECPICMDVMSSRGGHSTQCRHTMHSSCLKKWVTRGALTCPMCRAPLSQGDMLKLNPSRGGGAGGQYTQRLNVSANGGASSSSAGHADVLRVALSHDEAVNYLRHVLMQTEGGTSASTLLHDILYSLTVLS